MSEYVPAITFTTHTGHRGAPFHVPNQLWNLTPEHPQVMTAPDRLVVVSHRAWIAREFAAANVCPVHSDYGFDAPNLTPDVMAGTAWWMPTEHAARLLHAGVHHTLQATGPCWLPALPRHLTQRPIWVGTLGGIADAPAAGWCKPAEAKIGDDPIRFETTADFVARMTALGVPADTSVHVSPLTLDITDEFRVFIAHGRPVTATRYRAGDTVYPTGPVPASMVNDALQYAAHVTARAGDQPDGYVLDIAHLTNHTWAVLETNPAWSSNPYDADPEAVIHTLAAAAQPNPAWTWQPDPYLVRQAARKQTLKLTPPTWSNRAVGA